MSAPGNSKHICKVRSKLKSKGMLSEAFRIGIDDWITVPKNDNLFSRIIKKKVSNVSVRYRQVSGLRKGMLACLCSENECEDLKLGSSLYFYWMEKRQSISIVMETGTLIVVLQF